MTILTRMHEEDPTWVIEQSKELKQTILSGQGEFHLRTLKWRVENNDKLPIVFDEPRIPYRETITKAARADYRHKKQSGGAGQFGEVHLIIEPYTEGMPAPDTYKFGNQEFKMSVRDTQEIPLMGWQARGSQLYRRRCHRRPFHSCHRQGTHGPYGARTSYRQLCPRCACMHL